MQASAKALFWIGLVFVVGSVCGGLVAVRLDRMLSASEDKKEVSLPPPPISAPDPEPGQAPLGRIPEPPVLPRGAGPAGRASDNGMRVVERMIRQLGLDQDQRGQVRQIMQRTRARQMEATQELRTRMSGLRRQTFEEIVEVLTPDQARRFRTMVQRFNRFRRDRRPGGVTDRARPRN